MTDILDKLEQASNLQSLLDAAAEKAPAQSKTGVQRTKEIEAALQTGNIDEMLGLHDKLNKVVATILANPINVDTLGELDDEQLAALMVEQLNLKDVKRLLDVRYELRREAVFAHITARNEAKGIKDPAHTPGAALVPSLSKKFTREGGKMKAALDQKALKKAIGAKKWAKVIDTFEVPATEAHTEEVFSEEKFYELVQKDPKLMNVLADCVIPGGYGTPKFFDRDMTQEDLHGLGTDDEED